MGELLTPYLHVDITALARSLARVLSCRVIVCIAGPSPCWCHVSILLAQWNGRWVFAFFFAMSVGAASFFDAEGAMREFWTEGMLCVISAQGPLLADCSGARAGRC